MRKVVLYIATSSDGFIADEGGGVDWLPQPNDSPETDDSGYTELMDRIDTIVMGSTSYEQILGFGDWAWPEKRKTPAKDAIFGSSEVLRLRKASSKTI